LHFFLMSLLIRPASTTYFGALRIFETAAVAPRSHPFAVFAVIETVTVIPGATQDQACGLDHTSTVVLRISAGSPDLREPLPARPDLELDSAGLPTLSGAARLWDM